MSGKTPASLVLGTVQFGQPYGVANRTGWPTRDRTIAMLRRAVREGVAQLDTARAYGEAEERIGAAFSNAAPPVTVTKLDPLANLKADAPNAVAEAAVDASIAQSLAALGRSALDVLLLHRCVHLKSNNGAVWRRLRTLQRNGTIKHLGVSVQTPQEAMVALIADGVSHIQLPFNLLDWRWRATGVDKVLKSRADITVHARSAFLQGLLVARDATIWPAIPGVHPSSVIALLDDLVRELGRLHEPDLCLAYVRGQDWIDGVVVGMENEDQLETNLSLFKRPPLTPAECRRIEVRVPQQPAQLLTPALWNQVLS